MHPQYILGAWAIVAYLLYRFIRSTIIERRYAAKARSLGCKALQRWANVWPLGIEQIWKMIAADKKKRFPEHAIERYANMGNRTFEHNVMGNLAISTCDPKNVQAMLATQFKDFGLGERRRVWLEPIFGVGIFTADGKVWEHARGLMRPQFNREQVSDLELEEQHVQNMMCALRPSNETGWTPQVDLQTLFFRLTLDSACEFLFGESVDCQIRNLPENAELYQNKATASATDEVNFAAAFDKGQAWCTRRSRLMWLYWLVDSPSDRRNARAVHAFVDHFVQRALNHRRASLSGEKLPPSPTISRSNTFPPTPSSPSTIDPEKAAFSPATGKKEKYVFLEALATQMNDPIALRSQLLNILLAGRDTTASLLSWTFYLLARHPDVWTKLRSAILSHFGPYTSSPLSSISFSSLKNCVYLQHVLAESLRLYPVVPVNLREAMRDTTLPVGGGPEGKDPIFVRKGEQVDYSVHVMHRLKSLWGEDADEFRPDRWVGRKPGWEYLPFNGGPRICLGQQFALTESSYVIVRLLQRFEAVQNCDPNPVPVHNLTLTSCPANGVKVRLREAKS